MSYYLKDPGSRIDHAIDWGGAYLDGQAIADSAWSVAPVEAGGVAIEADSHDAARTAVTLSGGIAGHVYAVGNRITLTDGQIDERSILLRVDTR